MTVEQCPKGRLTPDLFSSSMEDLDLRVWARVKKFSTYYPTPVVCEVESRVRTQLADILTALSSAELRNEREKSKQ